MNEAHKIIEVEVSAAPSKPSTGLVRVHTREAEIEFEITQDLAHKFCADLERFLTR